MKTLLQEVETAHLLAMSYQTDIAVMIIKKKGDFFLEWKTEEPPLQKKRRLHKMRGVKNIRIDDKTCKKEAMIAAFSSTSSTTCRKIELEGIKGDSRILQLER